MTVSDEAQRPARPGGGPPRPGGGPSGPGGGRRRPWWFAGLGVGLAAGLAAVLFVGIGTGGGPATGGGVLVPQVAAAPGINSATARLLSLTVLPSGAPHPAPGFTLTDQHGRPVSPAAFRGDVVIVAPNDDRCTDLCTLLANDIALANQDLGAAAAKVVWLSVNANPFYPTVSDVAAWTDQHGLGGAPNWYFATGTPAALAQVWASYGIEVEQDPASRTVTHSTNLFYIDPSGAERAVAQFGTEAANTSLFAHGIAQMANDLLPASEQVHVGGPEAQEPTKGNATVSAVAPTFALPYLDDPSRTFRLSSTRGKVTVINFWASTCTLCRTELPAIEAAYKKTGSQVAFVGVDESDQAGPARQLAAAAGLSYPLVADSGGVAAGGEQIPGLPFTVILDPVGKVLVRHSGAFTAEQLEYLLENYDPAPPGS
ncbi:redoxin domain-containing protein [Acidiferrimicrobium sp. IK]|uniref:redoxin domain-containing protein n=1 Tax=Acidiferrimicrobium sp. IK TaxID=2871700 RepID=UPI0021CB92A7|nr:redoxin domain-containing protein [Acidiferrimicrobium sp. IK]MCU4186403.1 redoxin domain-containing protein [Acidiferrimicrobium sp. IK]